MLFILFFFFFLVYFFASSPELFREEITKLKEFWMCLEHVWAGSFNFLAYFHKIKANPYFSSLFPSRCILLSPARTTFSGLFSSLPLSGIYIYYIFLYYHNLCIHLISSTRVKAPRRAKIIYYSYYSYRI